MLPSERLALGWCQKAFQRGTQVCYARAWDDYCGRGRKGDLSWYDITRELLGGSSIVGWNDKLERTQAEVVALAKLVEYKLGLRPADDVAAPTEVAVA